MEKYFIAAMGGAEGFGHRSISRLINFFGSAEAAWSADLSDLIRSGVRRPSLEAFIAFRREHPNAPKNLVAYCERHQFKLCSIFDDDYPPILKEIKNPPMFFYYRGQLEPNAFRIGIVGSRENTRYGQTVALELGEQLAAAGLTVVSGAARGIDTFAHHGALKSGRTVAVLGCGIEIAFRSGKRIFFERITERGVVLSEFPPQLTPNSGTFPTRNRIIAGLCKGVIIVEAGVKSGALITSDFAADFGRDVFVIPGRVYDEKSRGCHNLIREGATLIGGAQDVLDEYDITDTSARSIELDGVAAEVFAAIPSDKFITDDEILMRVDIAPSDLPNVLLELERLNCIAVENHRYKRKPNVRVELKSARSIELDGVAAEIFAAIPSDKFITDDEILMRVNIAPNDLPNVLLELERLNCVTAENHRYKRKPNVRVDLKPAKSIELDGVAAEIFAAIPSDKFITDDEILMHVDIAPSDLPNVLLELERLNCVTAENHRYKRKPNVHVDLKPAKSIELDGVAAEIFAAIPSDKFITDDEILMRVDIAPSDLPNVLLELERLNCVTAENHRYKRKPNVHVELKPAKFVELDGVAAEIFAAIPSDKFITDDEILMRVNIAPSELPDIMIALELKGYITAEFGRYKRKV